MFVNKIYLQITINIYCITHNLFDKPHPKLDTDIDIDDTNTV